ncbi:MAG: helix-turn-helix transcriptional regulator [Kamptonema sp. SIO4C4]|nr:helix-turn-helix transcriptional regulator [Kamptonema sp. SIO4C4]
MSAKTPSHVDHQVGRRIRQARRDAKLTQEQLGNMIGLTFQQVQKYEKGVNRVSAGTLYEISQVLDLPISWFFDEDVVNRIGETPHFKKTGLKLKRRIKAIMVIW